LGEAKPEQKVWTSEEFITAAPLYVRATVDGFSPPAKIDFDCPSCEKETTWAKVADEAHLSSPEGGTWTVPDFSIKSVAYRCYKCGGGPVTVVYREMAHGSREVSQRPGTGLSRSTINTPPAKARILTAVMKVGQYPASTISIPKALSRTLGDEAAGLYRKALISRNSGYGLAAVGYMRRVVEDKTNELIEVAAQYAESLGAEPPVVATIRGAIDPSKYTPYEDKLKIAATVFPATLQVGSINPLKVLFADVSEGLHGLSEERCIEIADEIRTVFEYVFEKLRAEVDDRRAFIEKVKKLA
jgi:hypothetical protein